MADYFEQAVMAGKKFSPQMISNWITGELFAWLNLNGKNIRDIQMPPNRLVELLDMVEQGLINQNTAKMVLVEMLEKGEGAQTIVDRHGMQQLSDPDYISGLVMQVIEQYPQEVDQYAGGKDGLTEWFFGQVMRSSGGKGNPRIIRQELERQLKAIREKQGK